MTPEYMIFIGITAVMSFAGMFVGNKLKSKFKTYAAIPLSNGMSGADVAKRMLEDSGIHDVKIVQGQGFLSDHYNPRTKTISLSPDVYAGRSVSAAAVAAHECGHAVQHNTQYSWLKFRSSVVPVVSIASRFQQIAIIGAFAVFNQFPQLLLIAIGIFLITTLFSFITLPVEFDASKRALVWLNGAGITSGAEHHGAQDALKWAAMTYVVAALSALVSLLYLIIRYMGRR